MEFPVICGKAGKVIWVTGFSGAGKSTLARAIQLGLRESRRASVVIDGDMIRSICGHDCGFDAGERIRNARRVAGFAKLVAEQDVIAVVATISLYHEVHAWNRIHLPGYFEVLLETDIATCRRRDTKRVYRHDVRGVEADVVGIGIAAELPLAPDLRLDNSSDREDVAELAGTVLRAAGLTARLERS